MRVQLISAAAIALAMALPASASTIADSSFETPNVSGGYLYRPTATGATFSGDAGVDGGSFGFAAAPDGIQDGFLQSTGDSGAEIDLSVTGLSVGSVYSFSYFDAQRSGYSAVPYTVAFDGATLATQTASSTAWTKVTTQSFTATGTSGTLTFSTPLMGYDNDTGLDGVTLNGASISTGAVPEPASWALMLGGFGAMGAAMRRRRGGVRTSAA